MELLLRYERWKTKRVGKIVTCILFARQCRALIKVQILDFGRQRLSQWGVHAEHYSWKRPGLRPSVILGQAWERSEVLYSAIAP